MIRYYILLVILTVLGAFGAFFLKKSTAKCANFINIIFKKELYFGAFFYLISAILNIYVLKFIDYTVVLPFTAITYIWTMLIAYIFLNEEITNYKKFGLSLIIIGAIIISRG